LEATNKPELKIWKRPFFTIFIGQAFSLLGSQLVQFALVWYLTKETGSATVLATATLVAMLPQIFLSPFAGSWVDRGNRRRIMIAADSAIALATLLLAGLFAFNLIEIWHIYALMFVRSLGQAFHSPSFASSTSLMVPKEHLARIQGINQTLHGGLSIVSAPAGAILLELLPMQGVLAVDIVTAMIAVGCLLFVAVPQPERKLLDAEGKKLTFWQDFREGYRYVFTWPGLVLLMFMSTAINFLFTPAGALLPLLVFKYFGGGALELSWVEAIFGIGIIVGGLLLGVWGGFRRRILTLLISLILLGVSMAVIGFVPTNGLVIALACMFVAGMMVVFANGSEGAMFQAAVDPAIQGRVFTLSTSIAVAMTPLSLLVAGPIADRFGIQTWYIAGGTMCAVMGLVGFFLPAVMNVEDGRPDGSEKLDAATPKELQKAES
jgi:DHA3 family macrolide efflux protein-like MFS transporter